MSRANVWESPTYPEIGDGGQVMEYDAEVIDVNDEEATVIIEVFDEDDPRIVKLPFIIC